MKEFDSIIGYDSIKAELIRVCDMIRNPEFYERLGAKLPRGIILYGDPGVGKTTMAEAFIKASGRRSVTLRRKKPNGNFIREIQDSFDRAAACSPSVLLLEDLDKFSVEEFSSEELATVQSCIDDSKWLDIIIIATANSISRFPASLLRRGRFDKQLELECPTGEDATLIVTHYMKQKEFVNDVNYEDVSKMLSGNSCAFLESIINDAAIYAGAERCEKIELRHMVSATLNDAYGVKVSTKRRSLDELRTIAFHEAGHAVISELIKEGSVGIVSICSADEYSLGGFSLRCERLERRTYEILVSLGGKAATELVFGKIASGTWHDLGDAIYNIKTATTGIGTSGTSFLSLTHDDPSPTLMADQEKVIHAELERYLFKAKEILAQNREFLDAMANALLEKETLLFSDIRAIRESCTKVPPIIG